MIDLEIKSGVILTYDEDKDRVLVNGKPDRNWKPVFIPSGEDVPDFFGFHDLRTDKVYDVRGDVTNVVDVDDIRID